MMERKGTRLRALLKEWSAAAAEGRFPGSLSMAILDAMENHLKAAGGDSADISACHECLRHTGKNNFIRSLGNEKSRYHWAELCFDMIRLSGYALLHMFQQRVEDMPDRILFRDLAPGKHGGWSYRTVAQQIRETAAAFYTLAAPAEPRAVIFSDNSVPSACCDLACLMYDILDCPLNPHFNIETLAGIFDRLRINIAVTDSDERARQLQRVLPEVKTPFRILTLHHGKLSDTGAALHLGEFCKKLSSSEIDAILDQRRKRPLDEVATIMFTSGSEGLPKGVSFSIYNLVTKRFARAASLPDVGDDETLLCFLPLYHTFGRYLEMLGCIYWGGTYVFTGNPSFDTLASNLPLIRPTGLVSIPLRWAQLEEHCVEKMRDTDNKKKSFRAVVGDRLRWGLSAAGYLDPRVFQFFNRNGVDLSSGFGMTEATGGIMMTPPRKYVNDTNGIPLPGVRARLSRQGELEISGHYIARFLEDAGPGDRIPYPESEGTDYWLSTGDLFRVFPNGYYEILDRIKDIYKNDKGQTIAPRVIEKKFDRVPGIKNTFLVGDRKAYNVLLIVPDSGHPIFQERGDPENRKEYFHQIVSAANQNVAPYERVVNFAILDRDFDPGRGELTPKGTLNRRIVEKSFASLIKELYRCDFIELQVQSLRIKIPRWFYRELGILEDDILAGDSGLFNRNTGLNLPINRTAEPDIFLIGDLEYSLGDRTLDIGILARQPRLWIGNPSLIRFCPCKEGWDTQVGTLSAQVRRPWKTEREYRPEELPELPHIRERMLAKINRLISIALFSGDRQAIEAINDIGKMIARTDLRWNDIFRSRLEALSRHPLERIRCLAYQILLLDDPSPDYQKVFPAFVSSGLSFIDKESMEAIAGRFEEYRMEALRQRMVNYRSHLTWPADEVTIQQFRNLFPMLLNFVEAHPNFYFPVRAELATWSLFKAEPRLAESARNHLLDLHRRFEIKLAEEASKIDAESWKARLVFDESLSRRERRRIETLLIQTPFLNQAVMFAFQEGQFSIESVPEKGIWISRIPSSHTHCRYRMSVNLKRGRHYDLELVLGEDFSKPRILESLYWTLAIGGYPQGPRVLPRPGCFSVKMHARSNLYMGELTAWEKIREYSELRGPNAPALTQHSWRRLYIQALTPFYRGWMHSGFQIVPGHISPDNVTIPELDFKSGGTLVSLLGWRPYRNPLSLVKPMLENFYLMVAAHYPWCRNQIDVSWIFDACIEAMGIQEGRAFLGSLEQRLKNHRSLTFKDMPLAEVLKKYGTGMKTYLPLGFYNAVERFREFKAMNIQATAQAREQTVNDLYWLFRLNEYPEHVRYRLYKQTYFANARKEVARAFDGLLERMEGDADTPAVQLAELSGLQRTLTRAEDRNIFSRLVFPRRHTARRLEVTRVGENEQKHVIVSSRISDRHQEEYTFREPLEPREVGQLYNFFFRQSIPKSVSELDRHFVLTDAQDEIVGGVCYQMLDRETVQLEGIVVARALQERGIRSSMEEEFCSRMAGQGVLVVRTHYYLHNFYLNLGYRVDKRWGTLVKFLFPESPETA